jgi:hypothetical protein
MAKISELDMQVWRSIVTSLQGRLEHVGRPVVCAVPPVVPELVLALHQPLPRTKRDRPEKRVRVAGFNGPSFRRVYTILIIISVVVDIGASAGHRWGLQ